MAIDTGKILKTSLEDYFDLTGESILDYKLKYIAVDVPKPRLVNYAFSKDVPDLAEVVVDYREKFIDNNTTRATGTALVPKSAYYSEN